MDTTAKFSGAKLRALRLAQGLTQAELAHRTHVRERQIIRWENDQHVPRIESVSALAHALSCSVTELLSGEEDGDDEEGDPVTDLIGAIKALVRAEVHNHLAVEMGRAD